jgi:hypothetical protein
MARRLGQAVDLTELLESEWDSQLFGTKRGLCRSLGWNLCYHTIRSKGSQAGFPDRFLVRGRMVFVELKRELTGRKSEDANRQPTDTQREWLDGIANAGGEAYLWRPSDLSEASEVLARRWQFHPAVANGDQIAPPYLTTADATLAPRSVWVAGVGRAEELGAERQMEIA